MKLVTWNVQWCRGCDGRVEPARIVEHARRLADFDVLCLQEVASGFPELEGSRGEDQFAALARLLPDYTAAAGYAVDVQSTSGGRALFGNLILSRYPIRRVSRTQLPWPADTKKSMPRMLIEAIVETGSAALRVMTTHLEYYSSSQRQAQVEALRGYHAQACARAAAAPGNGEAGPFKNQPNPRSAVLTADFNFKPDDPLHMRLQADHADGAPAFRDAWTTAYPGRPHPPTLGVKDRKQWPEPYACDFVFVTEDLAPRVRRVFVDDSTDASDHQPVLVELDI